MHKIIFFPEKLKKFKVSVKPSVNIGRVGITKNRGIFFIWPHIHFASFGTPWPNSYQVLGV